jgi:hypothetical protein
MKHLRKTFVATVLTFVLACSAFAGDMGTGKIASATSKTADNMSTSKAEVTSPIKEIALTLLQNVLALF